MTGLVRNDRRERRNSEETTFVSLTLRRASVFRTILLYRTEAAQRQRGAKKQTRNSSAFCDRIASRRLVRMTGLEPAQPCDYKNLNLTRLPVPPHPQVSRYILSHLQRFATDIDVFCKKIFTFVRFYLA